MNPVFISGPMKLLKHLVRKRRKKESAFKYTMGLLHLWLGLLSSVVIFVCCLTGSLYAFKNQITDAYNRDQIYVKAGKNPLPLDSIQARLSAQNLELTSVVIPAEVDKSYVVSFTDTQTNAVKTQYLNPYSGALLGPGQPGPEAFFALVLDIHRTMLLNETGKQIVGASVLIFIFMMFSGFVLWLPRKLKDLKKALSVKFSGKWFRLNYDLHRTLGFYSLLLLFFMAVTGLYVTYPWVKNALVVSMGGAPVLTSGQNAEADAAASSAFSDLLKDMVDKQDELVTLKDVRPISLDSIHGLVSDKLPYGATASITLPDDKDPRYRIRKINTQNWLGAQLPDEISFDKTGVLKSVDLFANKPLDKQFTELAKPLHTGEIMGLPSIILYFVISLIGCSLPITGFIIWWKKVKP